MSDVQTFFPTRRGYRLAYKHFMPSSTSDHPGLFFLGGYKNHMEGTKATFIWEYAQVHGIACTLFDYFAHGSSEGSMEDGLISTWLADAVDIFENITQGPQVVVGSSMGGWIMMLLGQNHTSRIASMIGMAPAPGFTENIWRHALTEKHYADLKAHGRTCLIRNGFEYQITNAFLEDGRKHLITHAAYPFPFHIIHGDHDEIVPWELSQELLSTIDAPEVTFTRVKEAEHNLNRPQDLELMARFFPRQPGLHA
jgi:alpha-beta hydrolase superfamily lysophospholipase